MSLCHLFHPKRTGLGWCYSAKFPSSCSEATEKACPIISSAWKYTPHQSKYAIEDQGVVSDLMAWKQQGEANYIVRKWSAYWVAISTITPSYTNMSILWEKPPCDYLQGLMKWQMAISGLEDESKVEQLWYDCGRWSVELAENWGSCGKGIREQLVVESAVGIVMCMGMGNPACFGHG